MAFFRSPRRLKHIADKYDTEPTEIGYGLLKLAFGLVLIWPPTEIVQQWNESLSDLPKYAIALSLILLGTGQIFVNALIPRLVMVLAGVVWWEYLAWALLQSYNRTPWAILIQVLVLVNMWLGTRLVRAALTRHDEEQADAIDTVAVADVADVAGAADTALQDGRSI